MREETDTNSNFENKEIPDGKHTFEVAQVRKKGNFYVWLLEYEGGAGEQVLFPNNMGPLLRLLGCQEVSKGKFSWDTDLMEGLKFEATVSHEPDKKTGKIYQKMTDFKKSAEPAETPF